MPAKVLVDQGTEFSVGVGFENFVRKKEIKIYSTKSETKAAVAERAIKSLKNIIYSYMEESGGKYMRKRNSFPKTINARVNRSTGNAPKKVSKLRLSVNFLQLLD